MLEPQASRFFQAALQSGLIDEAGLLACFEQIPPEKRTADAIDRRMARQAISSGKLTLWQAQQILGGRASGFKIDKYILLDLLGRGGMGRVYLARDVRLSRLVAFKILSQERMNNPRAIARFQREAKVGAQLQHENLVRVYDEGDAHGVRYLVMEYIEGKNVGQLIGELGSIPWPTAARLTRQIALGLEHARLKELIHRDVNPCNILVTQDGTAKLTDLGLAIDLNDQDNVTRDGATVGTFDYVSPEQARHSRSVDTRADIYSLGCTIYHMIAGRVPFPVLSLPEKLYAHQLHEPDPLPEVMPGVPEGLNEVVRKMMRKSPDERFQTPLELAQALEPFAIESGWTRTPATRSPSTSGMSRSRPPSVEPNAQPVEAGAALQEIPASWVSAANLNLAGERAPSASDSRKSGSVSGSNPLVPSANGTPDEQGAGESGPVGSDGGGGTTPIPGVGDSFFPLDLGPDEALGEGLNPGSKTRLKPKSKANEGTPDPERRRRKIGLIVAGVVGALVTVAVVGALAILLFSRPEFVSKANEADREKKASKSKVTKAPVRGDIVVQFRDGESEKVSTLAQALAMVASRAGGDVILGPGTTVRVDNAKTIRLSSQGGVTIRAADGARPVLEVKLKGDLPMFLVTANLRVEGLTVVVRYETASQAPVFQVERDLTFSRCTFRADGQAERSRFAVAEGSKATVDGCLFEGFDTALHVEANPGMAVSLKDSIFLSAMSGNQASGRAVRYRSIYGQGAASRLAVEGCSTRSNTFLEVGNFSPTTPLEVDAHGSAFLVQSLLSFEGGTQPSLGANSTVFWKGGDNLFHVNGPTWADFAGGPTNFQAWSNLTGDSTSKAQPLKLAKEPPDPTTPKDCTLRNEADKPVGADPTKVGPG